MPQIKYTNEEKGGDFVLTPGEYEVAFTDYRWDVSKGAKTAGAETLNVKLETAEGHWIFDTIIFAPNTAWKASVFLRCFGLKFAEGQDIAVNDALLGTIMGHTGTIEVVNETYNNKTRNKLKAYIAAPGCGPDDAPPVPPPAPSQQPTQRQQPTQSTTKRAPTPSADDLDIPEDSIPF